MFRMHLLKMWLFDYVQVTAHALQKRNPVCGELCADNHWSANVCGIVCFLLLSKSATFRVWFPELLLGKWPLLIEVKAANVFPSNHNDYEYIGHLFGCGQKPARTTIYHAFHSLSFSHQPLWVDSMLLPGHHIHPHESLIFSKFNW